MKKGVSSPANMKSRGSVFDNNEILFPYAKKGDLTDINGYYVMEERDGQQEF